MDIAHAQDQSTWDAFIATQQFRPFMQSWTMGEVYADVGQTPIRLELRDGGELVGICQALIINAKRGKHLSVSYGPLIDRNADVNAMLIDALKQEALKHNCSFIRLSPFVPENTPIPSNAKPSPLHLLAEHIWYIPLTEVDQWQTPLSSDQTNKPKNEETIQSNMRKNTRNLIRRAQKEGVTIERSQDPLQDLDAFIELHEETRKRHSFTPYTNTFFRAQIKHFSARNECTLYKALYEGKVIASSVHMHAFGETSYHHGASTHAYSKIPASYLLQWTAIQDALLRKDHIYSFWGIQPLRGMENGKWIMDKDRKHPFSGVTTFKMGFGGTLLNLQHCYDIPVNGKYYGTRAFETIRRLKRGF